MSGERTYYGEGVFAGNNGFAIDPFYARGVMHPEHPVPRDRIDPKRYDLKNPEFRRYVDQIVEEGAPPRNTCLGARYGILGDKDEELVYIHGWMKAMGKPFPREGRKEKPQPCIVLAGGNRTMYAARQANIIRAGRKKPKEFPPVRLLITLKNFSKEQIIQEFVRDNARGAEVSIFEEHATVRTLLAANHPWEEVADELRKPVAEVKRLHEPLRQVELLVVRAFSDGQPGIDRAALRALANLKPEDQIKALANPALIPKKERTDRGAYTPPIKALDSVLKRLRGEDGPRFPPEVRADIETIHQWVARVRSQPRH